MRCKKRSAAAVAAEYDGFDMLARFFSSLFASQKACQ